MDEPGEAAAAVAAVVAEADDGGGDCGVWDTEVAIAASFAADVTAALNVVGSSGLSVFAKAPKPMNSPLCPLLRRPLRFSFDMIYSKNESSAKHDTSNCFK